MGEMKRDKLVKDKSTDSHLQCIPMLVFLGIYA